MTTAEWLATIARAERAAADTMKALPYVKAGLPSGVEDEEQKNVEAMARVVLHRKHEDVPTIDRLREENLRQARELLDPDATCCADASRVHKEQRLRIEALEAALREACDIAGRYGRAQDNQRDDERIAELSKLAGEP